MEQAFSVEYVTGQDKNTGENIYAFVMVPENKVELYRKKISLMGGDFEQEGAKVIVKGFGKEAPDNVMEQFKKVMDKFKNG